MYCLSPPLDELPQGDWFCPDCIAAATQSSSSWQSTEGLR